MRLFLRGLFVTALIASWVLGPSRAWSDSDPSEEHPAALTWQAESSHPTLGPTDSNFYLRIRVKAPPTDAERQPLHLALVFDRSGSMREEAKIECVRKAAHLVVDNLTKRDYLAFAAYNRPRRLQSRATPRRTRGDGQPAPPAAGQDPVAENHGDGTLATAQPAHDTQ
jgi:hypothetical protein